MKTIFTKFAAASMMLAAVACQREEMLDGNTQSGSSVELVPLTISATLESGQTKTSLQEGGKVHWEKGDAMTVLAVAEDATVTSYKFTTTDEGEEATFTNDKVALAENYYAVYPHNDVVRFPDLVDESANAKYVNVWKHSVSEGVLNTYIPSTQKVSENASGLGALSAGVVASDGNVQFKNIGGLIEINIPVEEIEHVILYGNAGESIVGNLYSAFGEDGLPVVTSVVGSNMVRMVPASGSTFNVGTYYINVAPITFTNGLTILFTKSDNTWAQVRSAGQFVVERSKISPLPEFSNLTFGGRVVEVIFCTDKGEHKVPFTIGKEFPASGNKNGGTIGEYTLSADNTLVFKIMGTTQHYRNTGAFAGLNFGKSVDDYFEIPAIEGYALNKVVVKNGDMYAYHSGEPVIKDVNSVTVTGCSPWTGVKAQGAEYVWSFAGTENTAYRIAISAKDKSSHCTLKQIRLYYGEAAKDEPSANPLITAVNTYAADTDPVSSKVTFNGSFTAVDYQQLSQFSCGFEYKPDSAPESEWTTVTCTEAANEFSYEETINSAEDYVYRAWTKVNKTGKTIYGSEVQFNPRKLVLHLVFHGQEGRDLLVNTWKWGTNGNNSSTKKGYDMNGLSYNFTYNGVDYPFTFWALQSGVNDKGEVATSGGYCFRHTDNVPNEALCLSNLGKAYAPEGHPAWMQFPGPAGMKLIEVNAELKNNFTGHICTAVNEDGTWAGESLAEYCKYKTQNDDDTKQIFPISLDNTSAGVRYYFTTEHIDLPRMLSLTLTYLYVGK